MPGHGYALPAYRCRLGLFLQQLPKTVCFHCYALRGRYMFPTVKAAMETRFGSLTHPDWIDAVTTLIYRSKDRYFRWHDSGDLQSIEHLRNIMAVCRNLPRIKFWLPTREYQTVEAYRRRGGRIPPNLCIRYSAHLVDGPPPVRPTDQHRVVSRKKSSSGNPSLSGCLPGEYLRQLPCMLEPAN
jgi:hypothetical protein